jgi:DNA-binding MarR family transcriptional regulator
MHEQRKLRRATLPREVNDENTWAVLLVLYINTHTHRHTPTTSVCKEALVSLPTGLRCLDRLQELGLVRRQGSKADKRLTEVGLTGMGVRLVDRYFAQLE